MKSFSRILILFLALAGVYGFAATSQAQPEQAPGTHIAPHKPKLVVGIVVDQMRYDFLTRYWDHYTDGGFRKLVNGGTLLNNTHYNYVPTYTGPGHSAIYTGTTPAHNGIVSNDWYDRATGKTVYCTDDPGVQAVGGSAAAGRMSPKNLLSTTITDQLKKQDAQSKVIGIAQKDRASILPAGHIADAAYWLDSKTGQFMTSTWYRKNLPAWVLSFNNNGMVRKLVHTVWKPLLPMDQYTASTADNSPYEGTFAKGEKPTFPYDLQKYANGEYGVIKQTPFGNTLTAAFAKKAVEAEKLGADNHTDFLAVSFSSTDYVGHRFGPYAVETEDTYLRLDRDLADLISFLEKKVGKDNLLIFLTADHGVDDVPQMLKDEGLPGGYFDSKMAVSKLKDYLAATFETQGLVSYYINQQVYLDHDVIQKAGLNAEDVEETAARFLQQFDGVQATLTATELEENAYREDFAQFVDNGFLPGRSGDVAIVLQSGWLDGSYYGHTGTSHGSPWQYDTHVPLVFYGAGIPEGRVDDRQTVIPDISTTLAVMLGTDFPSGANGTVISFK